MGFWKRFLGFDPNRKRAFPGEQPGEVVVYMGVAHWMILVRFFAKIAIAIASILVMKAYDVFAPLGAEWNFIIYSVLLTFLFHITCFRLYNYFLKVMLITNYRLIDIRHTVFLRREREVIPMTNIQDFRYQQNGILARIFKHGDLIVLGSSSDVKYLFHYVPRVNKIHHILGEIHQKAIREMPRSIAQRLETMTTDSKPVPADL